MRALLLLAILLISLKNINAQDIPDYLKNGKDIQTEHKHTSQCNHIEKSKDRLLATTAKTKIRKYDVLSYEIYMDWSQALLGDSQVGTHRHYNGSNTILLRIDSNKVSSLVLDNIDLRIESVRIKNTFLAFEDIGDDEFEIQLDKEYNTDDELTLVIYYRYTSEINNGGFYFFPKNDDTLTARSAVHENLAYTMSEPTNARKWVPCNDWPHDKALVSLFIEVPAGYIVAANGLLEGVEENTEKNTEIYNWVSHNPMPPYLISAAASKFKSWTQYFHRVDSPEDSIPVMHFCWEEDYENIQGEEYVREDDGKLPNAKEYFKNTPKMMGYFSNIFVEYPHEKYGHVVTNPYSFGGMEHQTLSMMHRNLIFSKTNWDEFRHQNTIVHELGHQWLGDLITCGTWNDLWINEGGAMWFEALWQEQNGIDNYLWYMGMLRTSYMYDPVYFSIPIYGLPYSNLFSYGLTYCKAGWVYHMLRDNIGRDEFFGAMNNMMEHYAYQSITTEQFKEFLKSEDLNPKIDLDTYFDQWVTNAGHPEYIAIMKPAGVDLEKFKYFVTVYQIQNGANQSEVFEVAIKFNLHGNDDQFEVVEFINNKRTQDFEIESSFPLTSFSIDTLWTLCTVAEQELIVSVEDENLEINEIFPNPISNGSVANIFIDTKNDSYIQANLYDSFGRKISEVYKGNIWSGSFKLTIPTTGLQSGVYYLVLRNGNKKISRKFSVIR
jgi:aminopeptidase N